MAAKDHKKKCSVAELTVLPESVCLSLTAPIITSTLSYTYSSLYSDPLSIEERIRQCGVDLRSQRSLMVPRAQGIQGTRRISEKY